MSTLTPRIKRGQQGVCLIYGLIDPFTNELRYIGMSSSGLYRPSYHFTKQALSKKTYLYNWINSIIAKGSLPTITVLEKCSKEDLNKREIEWIANAKANGIRLTNLTSGGEGTPGRIVDPKTCAKISKALTGKKATEETRKKLSESHIGLPGNMKGKFHSEESKKKISLVQNYKIKSIICKETGEKFRTSREAAKIMNLDRANLMKHLKGVGSYKTIKGFTFGYLEVTSV